MKNRSNKINAIDDDKNKNYKSKKNKFLNISLNKLKSELFLK